MFKCSYIAFWLWCEVKAAIAADYCPDGPWCGCEQHRVEDDE